MSGRASGLRGVLANPLREPTPMEINAYKAARRRDPCCFSSLLGFLGFETIRRAWESAEQMRLGWRGLGQ